VRPLPIPATLAEGCGKSTDGELARFTDMSLASAKELENHLILARDLGLLDADAYDELELQLDEVRRMLFAFGRAVRPRSEKKKRHPSAYLHAHRSPLTPS
jgi:S23 ribosomal protein.